jgi:hypothetical protein
MSKVLKIGILITLLSFACKKHIDYAKNLGYEVIRENNNDAACFPENSEILDYRKSADKHLS